MTDENRVGRGSTPPLRDDRDTPSRGGVHPLPDAAGAIDGTILVDGEGVTRVSTGKAEGWRGGEASGTRPQGGAAEYRSDRTPQPARSTEGPDSDFGIRGFLETSFLDWPGRIAAVLFLGGCNFRCPFCHNADLVLTPHEIPSIPLDEVLRQLAPLRGWVDAVVVSGGEPTFHPRLPELLGRLRSAGLDVKLDTNGSRPDLLARLLGRGAVQAVDMDVKAPLDAVRYASLAGVPVRLAEIRASIDLLGVSGLPHRFRTTYVPGLLDRGDLARLCGELPPGSPFLLQAFSPRRVLDPRLAGCAPPAPVELRELRLLCERAGDPLPAAVIR